MLVSSRQRYVLGDGAMQRMAQSNVFISGMGGLGAEIGRYFKSRLFVSRALIYGAEEELWVKFPS